MSAAYYIMMDGQVFGPYSYNRVIDLGILSDTMICTDDSHSQWKEAREYAEFRNLFIFSQPRQQPVEEVQPNNTERIPQIPVERVDRSTDNVEFDEPEEDGDEEDYDTTSYLERNQRLLFYKQKRKAALIGVFTLGLAGLAVVGVGNTWRGNIFSGTSFDRGGMGFVFKILSFMILSVIVAIPFFIISLIQLIYYSVKISQMS